MVLACNSVLENNKAVLRNFFSLREFDNRALKMNRKRNYLGKNFEIRRTEIVVKFVSLTYTEHKQGSFDSKDPLRPFLHFPFITFLLAQHTPKIIPPTDNQTFFRW